MFFHASVISVFFFKYIFRIIIILCTYIYIYYLLNEECARTWPFDLSSIKTIVYALFYATAAARDDDDV